MKAAQSPLLSALDSISKWADLWQLPISGSKSNWILFSNKVNIRRTFDFSLAHVPLQQTEIVKDLGILFDSHLKFSDHITNIVAKARQRLFLLYKCFITKDLATLLIAFKTFLLPILDYCSPIWSPHTAVDILGLE